MEKDRYTVVENAGYERERDIRSFDSYHAAERFRERQYTNEEIGDMHVSIRLDQPDGTSTYL